MGRIFSIFTLWTFFCLFSWNIVWIVLLLSVLYFIPINYAWTQYYVIIQFCIARDFSHSIIMHVLFGDVYTITLYNLSYRLNPTLLLNSHGTRHERLFRESSDHRFFENIFTYSLWMNRRRYVPRRFANRY